MTSTARGACCNWRPSPCRRRRPHDGGQIAGREAQRAQAEEVAGLADRADHVPATRVSPARRHRQDVKCQVRRSGRIRSFIAASTMAKFCPRPSGILTASAAGWRCRPGGDRVRARPRRAKLVEQRVEAGKPTVGRTWSSLVLDAEAATEVDVVMRMPAAVNWSIRPNAVERLDEGRQGRAVASRCGSRCRPPDVGQRGAPVEGERRRRRRRIWLPGGRSRYRWVFVDIGLTRRLTGARLPHWPATSFRRSSSAGDSMLKQSDAGVGAPVSSRPRSCQPGEDNLARVGAGRQHALAAGNDVETGAMRANRLRMARLMG